MGTGHSRQTTSLRGNRFYRPPQRGHRLISTLLFPFSPLATARPTLYLRSNAGQFSSTLIELDSVRAGVTAKICWPSAVTSNMGAGVSARFI